MAVHHKRIEVEARGDIVTMKPPVPHRGARAWDLHPALFAALASCFFGFLFFMGIATMEPGLVVPFGICAVFLIAFFAVPIVFARVTPKGADDPQSWQQFTSEGVETATGHLAARHAIAQMLTVPLMLLGWSVFIALFCAAAL